MKQILLKQALLIMLQEEQRICCGTKEPLDEALHMIGFLKKLMTDLKKSVVKDGFASDADEIEFFKNIKPQILGKLFYYNKIFKMEIACPVKEGKMYYKHFSKALKDLTIEHEKHLYNSGFYQYYRLGREDLDHIYFKIGNINYNQCLNSFMFEVDPLSSTYYDYKVAKIISTELLYNYLIDKLPVEGLEMVLSQNNVEKDILSWSGSKNELIELIYALYASGYIGNGKAGIRAITSVFQTLFGVNLGDIHHSFHRMKDRTNSRTSFLDHLKTVLEEYMDRSLL